MHRVLLLTSFGFLSYCGQPGRFRELANPNPSFACEISKEFACGIALLDTQTGTVYLRNAGGWTEEHPQAGKVQPRGTVLMRAPTGQMEEVPREKVEHYKALGAIEVGPWLDYAPGQQAPPSPWSKHEGGAPAQQPPPRNPYR